MKPRIEKTWKTKENLPWSPYENNRKQGYGLIRLGWNHSLIFESELEQDHGAWQQSPEREEWLPGRKNLIIDHLFGASFALADPATHHGGVHVMPKYNTVRRRGLPTATPSVEAIFGMAQLWLPSSQGAVYCLGADAFGGFIDLCLTAAGFVLAEVSTASLCPFRIIFLTFLFLPLQGQKSPK